MVSIYEMNAWVKAHELVMNRVEWLNTITEDRVTVGHRGCHWWADFLGRRLVQWQAYDFDSVNQACECLTLLAWSLWDCRREGLASFV